MLSPTYGSKVPTFEMHAGMRLAAAREMAKLTQEELAERIGMSRRSVSRWENSPEGAPPAAVLAYVLVTDVNYGWLMTGRENVPDGHWLEAQIETGAMEEAVVGEHRVPAYEKAPTANGEGLPVRPRGLEPRTRWLRVWALPSAPATADELLALIDGEAVSAR